MEVVHAIKDASQTLQNYDVIIYEQGCLPSRIPSGAANVLSVEFGWLGDCVVGGSFINYKKIP